MRVLLDATAVPSNRGGVGRYVDALVPALVEAGLDLVVVCQQRDAELMSATGARVVTAPELVRRRPARLVWEQSVLPMAAKRLRADVVHSPHYTMPIASPVPVAVTLHDATFFTDPEWHTPLKARFFRAWTRLAVRRAASVIVPSLATRDAVLRTAGGDPGRFEVAYHGVDRRTFAPASLEDRDRVAASLGLHGRYVAFLGTLEPRKNVAALVSGWADAVHDMASPPSLVLAGARGWDSGLDSAIRAVPVGLQVVVPGYVPLTDLASLLAGADVVAYPSLGEGFGLPVLEAMACGAAVLTTRRLSLPEVGGDAVAYCDVTAESIGRELRALLGDAVRRDRLRSEGLERARLFTWSASALAHIRAYERALSRALV